MSVKVILKKKFSHVGKEKVTMDTNVQDYVYYVRNQRNGFSEHYSDLKAPFEFSQKFCTNVTFVIQGIVPCYDTYLYLLY